jgi:hypothetical protein
MKYLKPYARMAQGQKSIMAHDDTLMIYRKKIALSQ